MDAQELIERYVNEVGRRLSAKSRQDIQEELRSLLLDQIEERAGGKEPSLQLAADVLREFGAPETMAAQYQPHQYLLGPQLFFVFRQVMTVVLIVLTVLYGLLLALLLWRGPQTDLLSATWGWLGDYFNTLLLSFGLTVLIFVGIERLTGGEIKAELGSTREWNPLTLPPVNDPQRIKRGDLLAEIVGSAIAMGIFLALSADAGPLNPFIGPGLWANLGWLVASVGVEILLKVLVAWQGRWNYVTRWLEIGSEVFGLYVLIRLISAGSLTTISPLNLLITIALVIAAAVVTITLIVKAARLVFADLLDTGVDGPLAMILGRK